METIRNKALILECKLYIAIYLALGCENYYFYWVERLKELENER
jgi:hypothetical protein